MVTIEELNELRQQAGYARFVHTNLHMHTPATPWDWNARPDQTIKADQLTPEIYFKYLNQTSLELVAITDHNCVNWCEPLIHLAKEGRKNGTSKLHILPGVEITTYEGPHILAIFDEDKDINELRTMLNRLGMSGDGEITDKVGVRFKEQKTIEDVFEIITEDEHGIIIAPHIQSKDGVFGDPKFRGKTKVLNDPRLRIIAAPSGDIKRVTEADGRVRFLYKSMDTNLYHNSFACINVSDCHRVDDFECDTTWIKMCIPSLEGVQQIIYEPEMRVSNRVIDTKSEHQHSDAYEFTEPQMAKHPHLIGLAISGGMLDGVKVALSPNQNSIIGKNYSGKSSVLDCIRFVMNQIPADEEGNSKIVLRLKGIIGEGGQVRAYLNSDKGEIYGVSRVLSYTNIGTRTKEKWQLDGVPEVYRLIDDAFLLEPDISARSIAGLEVYPQGDVVKVKDNVSQQMRIVNSLAKLDDPLRNLTELEMNGTMTLMGKIHQNSEQIIGIQEQIRNLESEVSEIPETEADISRLESLANSPLLDELSKWSETRGDITGLKQKLDKIAEELTKVASRSASVSDSTTPAVSLQQVEDINGTQDLPYSVPGALSPNGSLQRAIEIQQIALDSYHRLITEAKGILDSGSRELMELLAQCSDQYERVKQSVQETLGGNSNENAQMVLLDRLEEKRSRLRKLEDRRQDLEEQRAIEMQLQKTRSALLSEFSTGWDWVRKKRQTIVQLINEDSSDNIEAKLVECAENMSFKQLLGAIADELTSKANRISNKQDQTDLIVNALTPTEFLVYVKRGDIQALTSAVDSLTENTARILMGMSLVHIHRLESCVLDDRFVISYRREGESTFTPIDGGLSGGEQALALLSVAMVRKPLPLVIDQPEDELGQALITKDLVESIRKVKSHRQLIFVTHVPNIPVLADSEQVIYMEQERIAGKAALIVKHTGSLEDPEIINRLLELEGGRVAMKKRHERYAPLLERRQHAST